MKHLSKFNEVFFFGGEPMSKFFWLRSKSLGDGQSAFTIGEYETNPKHDDGSDNNYPWYLIGSDEVYSDEDIREMYDVLDEIPFPNK